MDSSLPPQPIPASVAPEPVVPVQSPVPQVPPKKSILPFLFIFLVIFIIGIGGFFVYQKLANNKISAPTPMPTTAPTAVPSPTPSPDPYLDWQTYNNIVYQYSLKYPPAWKAQAIGAGAGLDISEEGVKKTYPYGVFTIQGFARSTESNYKGWTKSEILLDETKAVKYERLNRKDLKTAAIIIKSPNNKFIEILFRETPDSSNWNIFNQILSSFNFLDPLDPAGWNVYKNTKYEYQISYPTDIKKIKELDDQNNTMVAFSGKDISFEIKLGRDEITDANALESYFYLDNPIARTTTLNGLKVNIYESTTGYCDGPTCSKPFIAHVFWHQNRYCHLIFYGDTQMSEAELLILSTFKFIE